MDISSYEYSVTDPAWSAIASILPSVFDPAALPDTLINLADIYRVCESWSVPLTHDLDRDGGVPPSLIGKGASFEVYAEKFDQWDKLVAVKYLRSTVSSGRFDEGPTLASEQATILREISTLRLFHYHPNFVSILGWGTRPVGPSENLFLVVDYAPLGSLDRFLSEYSSKLTTDHFLKICSDVADGINAMHSERMAHGDVKTANILIFQDSSNEEQYTAKISDLGFSLSLDLGDVDTCYRGTDVYNAPEIRGQRSKRITDLDPLACDVYSYGLLVWTVFKLGIFFLADVLDSAMRGKSEAEIRDSVGAPQLFEYAMEFAKSRTSEVEAALLAKVFSGSLQETPILRLSMENLCSLFSGLCKRLPMAKLTGPKTDLSALYVRPTFPDALNVNDSIHSYPQPYKRRIADKLLIAAENSKNPRGGELAYAVSKCFAAGFGFAVDMECAIKWLEIAASRGHDLAKILTADVQLDPRLASLALDHDPIERNTETALLLDRERRKLQECFETMDMSHIDDFELYLDHNIDAINSGIEGKISHGVDISLITGYTVVDLPEGACGNVDVVGKLPLLHWAVGSGRIDLVRSLLSFGVDLNATDNFREWGKPLVYAIGTGQIDIAELLLNAGAHVDEAVHHFLFMIPPHRFKSCLRLIRQAPKCPRHHFNRAQRAKLVCGPHLGPLDRSAGEEPPLCLAAKYNNGLAIVEYLGPSGFAWTLEHYHTACRYAATNLQSSLCDYLFRHAAYAGHTMPSPLGSVFKTSIYSWMLFHGQGRRWLTALRSTVAVLVSHGVDVNGYDQDGKTAMSHAVRYHANEPTVASTLLAHGASLDIQEGHDGMTLLGHAIAAVEESDNVGCVRWLLQHDVPLAVQWSTAFKLTPLHEACYRRAYGAVEALLESGKVDINFLSDSPSHTPLHAASSVDSVPIVKLLLEHGADATSPDGSLTTPLEVAVDGICLEVVELFLSGELSIENPHFDPPRSIMAYYSARTGPQHRKIWQMILKHTQRRHPEHLSALDARGQSPLAKAALHENHDFIFDLLNAGVNIGNPLDENSAWMIFTDQNGPPYQYYYHSRDPHQMNRYRTVVEALVRRLKEDGQLEACNDDGESLIFRAAQNWDVTAVEVLLKEGACVKGASLAGTTALHAVFLGLLIDGSFSTSQNRLTSTEQWQGRWEPSSSLALLKVATVLLDAGADPNACRVDGMSVLHLAVLTAWRLGDTTSIELLVARGADVNKPISGTQFKNARPIHFALEAPTITEAWVRCPVSILEALNKEEGRSVRITKSLVRTLLAQNADLDVAVETADRDLKDLLMGINICNPIALQAMLTEGVSVSDAIHTCNSAAICASALIRYRQAAAVMYGEHVSNLTYSAWTHTRRSGEGWQSFGIVADWIHNLSQNPELDALESMAMSRPMLQNIHRILTCPKTLSRLISEGSTPISSPQPPHASTDEQQVQQTRLPHGSHEEAITSNAADQSSTYAGLRSGLRVLTRVVTSGPQSWKQRLSKKSREQSNTGAATK